MMSSIQNFFCLTSNYVQMCFVSSVDYDVAAEFLFSDYDISVGLILDVLKLVLDM